MKIRIVLAFPFVCCLAVAAVAQPNPNDNDVRFWVKADDLITAGLADGAPVKQWVDASSYKTIMSPRTAMNPNGPAVGEPVEENPHLQLVDINGRSIPSVRFDRSGDLFNDATRGDPDVDGSGPGDRLYQTNNFDDRDTLNVNEDPTAIGDGTDLTAFMVFSPDITDSVNNQGGTILGAEVIFAKRGDAGCLYEIGVEQRPDQTEFGKLVTVNYDAKLKYPTDIIPPEKTWQIVALTIEEADPENEGISDLINWYHGVNGAKLVNVGGPLEMVDRNNAEALFDGVSGESEPFGIGAHSQNCCGEGESYAGNIAEILIMSKLLAPEDQEFKNLETYFNNKYFGPGGIKGDFDADGQLDLDDINMLVAESASGTNDPKFDVTNDAQVNSQDVSSWAKDLKKTWIGDSNLDNEFNSGDLVAIFQAGKFEQNTDANWSQGDWTGDLRFNSGDLVAAFQDGGFERGPRAAAIAVPEPIGMILLLTGLLASVRRL